MPGIFSGAFWGTTASVFDEVITPTDAVLAEREEFYADAQENGVAISFLHTVPGVFVPSSGTVANPTQSYSTFGIITSYSTREIDGTLIKQGDKRVLLAIPSTGIPRPTQDDKLTINGVPWSVVVCDPVAPADMDILYQIQARK